MQGVGISLKPKWNHTLGPGWEMRLEGFGGPQLYAGEVDSYWEAGGKLTLVRTYGHKSELSLNFQSLHWLYDDREQNNLQGEPVPGTSLAFWRPEVFGQWRHNWDAQRRWTTTTKFGWLWNQDNGSGYWNYDRVALSQKVRWRQGGWEIAAGARVGWYLYARADRGRGAQGTLVYDRGYKGGATPGQTRISVCFGRKRLELEQSVAGSV